MDSFDGDALALDPEGETGWAYVSGDGEAKVEFRQKEGGLGVIAVDAREDRRNIWWAIIRRKVSDFVDMNELLTPGRELRIEARIRSSAAPRRVNLHFNHTRTDDFHSFLMEFDIPDTERWHTISMTTSGFDARPGDEVFAQLALMDWGRSQYELELDYIKAEVVDPSVAGPDLGNPLPYRPAVPPLSSFGAMMKPSEAAMVDTAYPWVNFRNWKAASDPNEPRVLTVSEQHLTLLRWDFGKFARSQPDGWGVLQLTTHSAFWAETGLKEFGELRLVEILGGDPTWERDTATLESFLAGEAMASVLNGQMVVDTPPALRRGEKTSILVSPPVLQRLFDGRTKGLALYAQGGLSASFFADDAGEAQGPQLHFNARPAEDLIAKVDFENRSSGVAYRLAHWEEDGFSPRSWSQGFNDGRVLVDDSAPRMGSNCYLRVSYPKGGVGPQETGAQTSFLLEPRSEFFISYWLRFEEGFSWGGRHHGGKLPGLASGDLCSGGSGCDGTNGFTARMMWRKDGAAVLYLYHMDKPHVYGEDFPLAYSSGDGVVFTPGRWFRIAQRVRINSGENRDGEVDLWVDGESVLALRNLRFVTNGELIDQLFFSTFHGGNNPDWAPRHDSYINFDDFRVGRSLKAVMQN